MAFRTDRNNNPTAMTTDVAKTFGLQEGKDFVRGDKFPTGNLYTAKLLGDGFKTTVKALDTAAKQGRDPFYTATGTPRWTHTAIPTAQYLAMNEEQKVNLVKSMYKKEGGSGTLSPAQQKRFTDLIDELRGKGGSDTKILDFISQKMPQATSKIAELRQKAQITGKSDREVVNFLSQQFDGTQPKKPSNPLEKNYQVIAQKTQERAKQTEQKAPGFTFTQSQGVVAKPQAQAQPEKKGFFGSMFGNVVESAKSGVKEIGSMLGKAKETYGATVGQIPLKAVGTAGAIVGDVLGPLMGKSMEFAGKAVKPYLKTTIAGQVYKSLPEHIKKPIEEKASKLSDKAKEGIGILTEKGSVAYADWAKKNPEWASTTKDIANSLNLVGIDELAKVGVQATGDIIKAGIPQSLAKKSTAKYAENLNGIFDNSTISINKINKAAGSRGLNLGEKIAENKISPIIENDRLKFDVNDAMKIDEKIAADSKVVDEVVDQYAHVEQTTTEIKQMVKESVYNDPQIMKEGRAKEIYSKISKKIDDFAEQFGTKSFNLPMIQQMKKGMWALSKKYGVFDIGKSDSFSKFGDVLKDIIEKEVPDVRIKGLNAEIGQNMELHKFLSYVDKRGGIVLKGGKVGKFFEMVTGGMTGAGLGAAAGGAIAGPFGAEVGAAIGSMVGSKASEMIREIKQNARVLGVFDRFLMKALQESPESQALIEAKAFIDKVKSGVKPTASKRIQENIRKQFMKMYDTEIKMLPAPKEGAPMSGITTPINLGEKSVSTLEAEDLARVQREALAKKARAVGEKPRFMGLPEGKTAPEKPSVIELPAKKPAESKLLTQDEAYKYYQDLGSRFGKDYNLKIDDLKTVESIDAFIEKQGDKIPEEDLLKLYEVQNDIITKEKAMADEAEQAAYDKATKGFADPIFQQDEEYVHQYGAFKKILSDLKIKSADIETMDASGLSKLVKEKGGSQVDFGDTLYTSDWGKTGDDILEIFKKQILSERGAFGAPKKPLLIKPDIKPSGLAGKLKEAKTQAKKAVQATKDFYKNMPNKEGGYVRLFEDVKPKGQKKDPSLMVFHNTTERNYNRIKNIGGMANPSVAISDVDKGIFDSYGDITLVGDKDLPFSGKGKTVGGDIYSPRFPSTNTIIKDFKVIENKLKPYEELTHDKTYNIDSTDPVSSLDQSPLAMADFLKTQKIELPADLGKDAYASRRFLRDLIEEKKLKSEFSDYISNLVEDAGGEEKIFAGYTPMGNRKYKTLTAEEASKIMSKQPIRGGEGHSYGLGSVRAQVAPEFKTIAQIQKNQNRLTSKEEFDKLKVAYEQHHSDILNKLEKFDTKVDSNPFIAMDNASEALADYLGGVDRKWFMEKYKDITPELMKEIQEFKKALENMPTQYFETKFKRVVQPGEFKYSVTPDNVSEKTLERMRKDGLKIVMYKAGDMKDRMEKILSLKKEMAFSLAAGAVGLGLTQ